MEDQQTAKYSLDDLRRQYYKLRGGRGAGRTDQVRRAMEALATPGRIKFAPVVLPPAPLTHADRRIFCFGFDFADSGTDQLLVVAYEPATRSKRYATLLHNAITGAFDVAQAVASIGQNAMAVARHYENVRELTDRYLLDEKAQHKERLFAELSEALGNLARPVDPPQVFKVTPGTQPTSKRGRRFLHPDPDSRQARYSQPRKK